MLRHFLAQQTGINTGVENHKRCAKAGREGGLRLFDTLFGAGDFGSVAGKKVIHRLFGSQPRYRRQYTERIGGEHDDVAWIAGVTFRHNVVNAGERI